MLADSDIRKALATGAISVRGLRKDSIGSNSIDLHLAPTLAVYTSSVLDAARQNPIHLFRIPDTGYMLEPGRLYLGVTREWTETTGGIVPWLDGKSSAGRLGLSVHATAGRGDAGFQGHWTLEISVLCARPLPWYMRWRKEGVIVYPGMPIAQLSYFRTEGPVEMPYGAKPNAKYANTNVFRDEPVPVPSRMHQNLISGRWT